MRSSICFFITTWLELTQSCPAAYWFQHTICKMESFQITSSLCLSVGLPVAYPAISPWFPNTHPQALDRAAPEEGLGSHQLSKQLDSSTDLLVGEQLCGLQWLTYSELCAHRGSTSCLCFCTSCRVYVRMRGLFPIF